MLTDTVPERRSCNTTFNMVYLIKILKCFSDDAPVPIKEINKKCDFCSEYTLRNLLNALYIETNRENTNLDFRLIKYVRNKKTGGFMEWDINKTNTGKTYYYQIKFDTTKSEIKILTDALSMFPFLSSEQTIKLIKKIEQISSVPNLASFRKIMRGYNYKARSESKFYGVYSSNELFKVIERITEAMKLGKCVRFDYCMYVTNPEKNRLIFGKRSEKVFHPAFFLWSNGFYYIIGKDSNRIEGNFINLRVDRIQNVEICKDLDIHKMEDTNPAKYRDENPVMYAGEPVTIEFRVRENFLNAVVDSFGRNIQVKPIDFSDSSNEDYIIVKTSASIDGAAMWLTEYCNIATALNPLGLVEKVKKTLKKGLDLYNK